MKQKLKKIILDIWFFFPIQILILNLKKNQIFLFFWLILFLTVTSNFGTHIGLPYLFLDPEYNHEVSFYSMLVMGIAFGIFTISFFITTYILDSHKFQFLGTIKYPFTKFCVNNSIIPLLFIIIYIYQFVTFQFEKGFEEKSHIFIQTCGFLLGFWSLIVATFIYFRKTNKDLFRELAKNVDQKLRGKKINVVQVIKKIDAAKKNRNYKIRYYINLFGKIKPVDDNVTYDKKMLIKVFDQHHINAITIEVILFVVIMIIGVYRDVPIFKIPAAASSMLLFSFLTMIMGAIAYWLRQWAFTGFVIFFLFYNFLVKNEYINSNYEAFGLNYKTEKVEYSVDKIEQLNSDENYHNDMDSTKQILNIWRKKFPIDKKPKLVIVTASGGGQRAAAWTTRTLQYLDKKTNGEFSNKTTLITGASGGLVGACYYRELYLRKKLGIIKDDIASQKYYDDIGKDILNPMIFSLVVSDMFFRNQTHTIGEHKYYKGRGYAFEEQLNNNTHYILDKKVKDYAIHEKKALIPMVIMAPMIINDFRKLYISAQPISWMNRAEPGVAKRLIERDKGVDFMRMFKNQEAENLKFTSALRMSATFPYITPNVQLPSQPTIEIMDAGLSDNFGISDAIRFVHTFRKWINENTTGVVIVCIRDSDRNPFVKKNKAASIFKRLFSPLTTMYTNFEFSHDFQNDNYLEYTNETLNGKLDLVTFEYVPRPKGWEELEIRNIDYNKLEEEFAKERAKLSWHLTKREKESIKRTIESKDNLIAFKKLQNLLAE